MIHELRTGKILDISEIEDKGLLKVETSEGILEKVCEGWWADRFKTGEEIVYAFDVFFMNIAQIWPDSYWAYVKETIPDAQVLKAERKAKKGRKPVCKVKTSWKLSNSQFKKLNRKNKKRYLKLISEYNENGINQNPLKQEE